MTKNQLQMEINDRLGRVLQHARLQCGSSISSLAMDLDLSEDELRAIEVRPAEIPCCELFRVIQYYGPEFQTDFENVLYSIQMRGPER